VRHLFGPARQLGPCALNKGLSEESTWQKLDEELTRMEEEKTELLYRPKSSLIFPVSNFTLQNICAWGPFHGGKFSLSVRTMIKGPKATKQKPGSGK